MGPGQVSSSQHQCLSPGWSRCQSQSMLEQKNRLKAREQESQQQKTGRPQVVLLSTGTAVRGMGLWHWGWIRRRFMLTSLPQKCRPAHSPPQELSPYCFHWKIHQCSFQFSLTDENDGASTTAMLRLVAVSQVSLFGHFSWKSPRPSYSSF